MTEEYRNPDVGETPPNFSLGLMMKIIGEKGLSKGISDERIAPHTHLFLILSLVFLVSLVVIAFQFIN